MLVISERSWHYKWLMACSEFCDNGRLRFNLPRSLCGYFWTLVFHTLKALCLSIVILAILFAFPISAWSWLHNGSQVSKFVFWVYLILAGLAFGTTIFAELKFTIQSKLQEQDPDKPLSLMNVIIERIKASKEKVCPTVRYDK